LNKTTEFLRKNSQLLLHFHQFDFTDSDWLSHQFRFDSRHYYSALPAQINGGAVSAF